ncbi:MAG: hypothetical protein Q4C67_11075, partial [Deinococcus sp.]|nr:hypothetical protein [Deinococcus sp.]
LRHEHDAMARQIAAIEARMQQRLAGWVQQAEACGLPRLPLDMAPAWLQQRQQALDILEEKTSLEHQHQHLLDSIDDTRKLLWSLLRAQGTAEADMPGLAPCVQKARTLISLADQAQGQRKTWEAQIAQERQNLVRLDTALKSARSEWQGWERRWQQALAGAGLESETPVEQAEAQLKQLDAIESLLDAIRQLRQQRIEPMQADL